MAKFYVQSGNLEMVLQAHDTRCAAIWAVHRSLAPTLPFLCEEPEAYLPADDSNRLGDTIRVNERGFDRTDSVAFDTLEIVTEWNQLLLAIDRIQEIGGCDLQDIEG